MTHIRFISNTKKGDMHIMKKEKIKSFFSSRAAKGFAVFIAVVLIGVAVYANYRLFYDPT